MSELKIGLYRHYKGKQYFVEGTVLHTETKEKMVLYRPCYECDHDRFVRPLDMFTSMVQITEDREVPRFEYIGDQ